MDIVNYIETGEEQVASRQAWSRRNITEAQQNGVADSLNNDLRCIAVLPLCRFRKQF